MSKPVSMPEPMHKALPVLELLTARGFEAVFVGGCVRDTIMGLPIHDVDIATSAKPDQVMDVFPSCIPTGLQHGTVTVRQNGKSYEVTTFREESAYEKHRRPSEVVFISNLDGDLLRRDLTINAIAMNKKGQLYDPFGGLQDIQSHAIRCVGDAEARFQEDALRMLRAVRFAAKFRYSFTYRTWRGLRLHRELLVHIAMERVFSELDRMLAGKEPELAIHLLARSGLLRHTAKSLPAIERLLEMYSNALKINNLRERICRLRQIAEPDTRWAALLLWSEASMEQVKETLSALRLASKRQTSIAAVIYINKEMTESALLLSDENSKRLRSCWIESVIAHGKEAAHRWLDIMKLESRLPNLLLDKLSIWLEAMPACSVKQLAVNGNELTLELGLKPGEWLGKLMRKLLMCTAAEELPNERQALLDQAKIWMSKDNDHDHE
ncbi:CCA tRNA nucleotidyltransferase [Paenibacillus sp. NEAU-GSW1]|uniref:CCA tRNA nucleotidyltransferase n=1 Tax=Paenibacillus sp. NEAU-GSW1 TaxID=2682486 RepID=UPI0012E31FE2|nr:CCA tRNA nucleotidyltransferase [Paenibacillus sp. NEAU-GSW1]MUT65449.1 CCA tRNA nucleotidyltransferase [Paenibacillus sp. NEAU-GSW1]